MQSRGLLGRLLGPLLKTGLPLLKNKLLAKSILIPLWLTAAGSGMTILIISNKEVGWNHENS